MDDVRAPQSPVDRIAGAPISWGVCEVPDRGYRLAPSPVLAEMRQVGLAAGDSGPEGFLPPDPDARPAVLAAHGLTAVDGRLARQVQSGRVGYAEAVRAGLYRPLGQGDVDVPAVVGHLAASGYTGRYVLERDTVLTDEPVGEGPAADVHTGAEHLRALPTRRALVP